MGTATPDRERLAALSEQVDSMFRSLLAGEGQAAILDFPDHPNVGDSAIFCGEVSSIQRVWSGDVRYIASFSSYDRQTLDAVAKDSLLLIHGGGNIGELYPHHHQFRLKMLRDWAGRRLIQLPQTIFFSDPVADDEFARAIEKHANFHLIVRDRRSFEHATARYQCEVTLAPDSAFALPELRSAIQPTHAVMALCRTDAERRDQTHQEGWSQHSVSLGDWPRETSSELRKLPRLIGRVGTTLSRNGLRGSISLSNWSFNHRAWSRLQRGLDLLSIGHVVATDRLHAYILASKLGKHYFVADNSYGKLSAVYRTWLDGTTLGCWTDDLNTAITSALEFSRQHAGRVALR